MAAQIADYSNYNHFLNIIKFLTLLHTCTNLIAICFHALIKYSIIVQIFIAGHRANLPSESVVFLILRTYVVKDPQTHNCYLDSRDYKSIRGCVSSIQPFNAESSSSVTKATDMHSYRT